MNRKANDTRKGGAASVAPQHPADINKTWTDYADEIEARTVAANGGALFHNDAKMLGEAVTL